MSLIEVSHLSKDFGGGVRPLRDVSFTIEEADVVLVIGPSGTGKSTLLRCLNRLEEPTAGRIVVDGQDILDRSCDITRVRRKMGMVFQSFNLFDNHDALGNVCAAPMRLLGMGRAEAERRGMELLGRVGLQDKAHCFPEELSGGQQQRVAIARSLAMDPKILLLDEPTSALDPTMVGEVLSVIRGLAEDGMAMVVVTHELGFARAVASRVLYLDDGTILEEGTPEEVFDHPKNEKCRRFVRHLRTLDLTIEGPEPDYDELEARLERFCSEAALTHEQRRRLTLAFEELVFHSVLPTLRGLGAGFPLEVSVEHAEGRPAEDDGGALTLHVRWRDVDFDPLAAGDGLTRSLLSDLEVLPPAGDTAAGEGRRELTLVP